MRYQAALRPDLAAASRQGHPTRQGAAGARVARRRRKGKAGKWVGRLADAAAGDPGALSASPRSIGSLVAGQSRMDGAGQGTTIYLADNGIHADIIMPVAAQGLDWRPLFPTTTSPQPTPARAGSPSAPASSASISTRRRWWDITPRDDLVGARRRPRVMHVEYVASPRPMRRARSGFGPRNIAACGLRSAPSSRSTPNGRPQHIAHPGYGCCDAFYRGHGKGQRGPDLQQLGRGPPETRRRQGQRLAAVREGLTWRYRRVRP